VRDREVIFNLAGQVSHIDSLRDPYSDLEINCRSQLTLLEACRHNNPAAKVVYAGTRQIYGRPDSLPVNEGHLVRPTDVNGINKAAGEYYHLVYNNVFGVRACSLRLTNVYGPRQLIRHNRQGFIGWFIRLALEGREIQVYGDGSQLRDFVYVDDVADAFLRAGMSDACNGGAFNVGGLEPVAHRDLVAMLITMSGRGSMRFVAWPDDKRRIDILLEVLRGDVHPEPEGPSPMGGTSVMPASTSATWRDRVRMPSRFSFPAMLSRQPRSPASSVSAPLALMFAVFRSTMALERSGYLTQNVPPKPQQTSASGSSVSNRPSTLLSSRRGCSRMPSSRSPEQES